MKHFYYTAILVIATLLQLFGCSNGGEHKATLEYIPFKEDSNDLYGFISADGEILYQNEFESCPSPVVDGLFFVYENGSYSLYKAEKKPKLLKDGLAHIGQIYDNQDYIVASEPESHVLLLNKKGETVKTIENVDGQEIKYISDKIYDNKYLLVKLKNKDKTFGEYAFTDLDGKPISYFNDVNGSPYCFPPEFSGDKILVGEKNKNAANDFVPNAKVVNFKGETVLDIDNKKYTFCNKMANSGFKHNLICVYKGERVGFLNMNGDFNQCPSQVSVIDDWNEDFYIYSNGGTGIMTMNHDIVVRNKYNSIEFLEDGGFIACLNDKWEILDKEGNIVESFECESGGEDDFDGYSPYIKGFGSYVSRSNSIYTLVDKKGKEVGKKSYSEICAETYYNHTSIDDNYVDWNKEMKAVIDSLIYLSENGMGKTLDEFDYFDAKKGKPKNYTKDDLRRRIKDETKFKAELYQGFDKKLASYNYSYYSSSSYSWNTNAKCRLTAIEIRSYKEKYGENIINGCLNYLKSVMTSADDIDDDIKTKVTKNICDDCEKYLFKKNGIGYIVCVDKGKGIFIVGIDESKFQDEE